MGVEIERKFLVTGESWRRAATRSVPMWQGYLAEAGKASTRIRLEGTVARLNIKAAVVGSMRTEYEYEIPAEDAQHMLETLCVATLRKVRHYVPNGAHEWEVDVFEGDNAGLVMAEIELRSPDEAFERPRWLGPEVTENRRYYNHALALHPYSRWK